ncbi:MAG: EI24 domain-containing protein [Crocinitomicaceae bacterium]
MFVKDFSAALKSYKKGAQLVKELKLWKFFFLPALVGLLLGTGIIALAYWLSDDIGGYIGGFWPWEFGAGVINSISNVLGGFIVIILGVLIFKHAVMALSAPFMAPISERIEMHLTGKELNITNTPAEFLRVLMRGIRINVRNLLLEILITIPLLIMGLIPLLNIVSVILIFYIQSYYAGFGNMDYTLERHLSYSQSVKFIRKNKGLAAGNGLVFVLFLFIPVVGIALALPLSTAAATVATLERLEKMKK